MGVDRSQPRIDRGNEERPALSAEIRQHLGRLLASAYEARCTGPGAAERFADLLARLGATLDEGSRRDTAEFQAQLLALTPALHRFAVSLVRDPSAADDLVQDTLLRAWQSRSKFRIGTNFGAWTFTILRNRFYSERTKFRELPDEDGARAACLVTIPEQSGHVDWIDFKTALSRLAAPMRESLVLVTIEGLSCEEAAMVMDCQPGTVKSRVWRARSQLARMLGYDGSEIGGDGILLSAMANSG